MSADSRKTKKKKSILPKKTKSRSKKPKVKLAQERVYALCALICILCGICLGTSLALHKLSEKKSPSEAKTASSALTQKKEVADVLKNENHLNKTGQLLEKSYPSKTVSPVEKNAAASKTSAASAKPEKKQEHNSTVEKKVTERKSSETKNVQTQSPAISEKKQRTTENNLASIKGHSDSEKIERQIPKKMFDIPAAKNGATVVIVIDDAGRSVENVKRYASLPFPVTIAVLPKLANSRECADVVRQFGQEVILHQPMQAENLSLDPGPGAIKADMNTYDIASVIKQNLRELGPGVKGMNNHEGSLITANEIKIGAVLDVCAEENVYFLDSRTTAATKAPQAALERDMSIFEKAGPYIDNDLTREKMLERMYETLAYANNHGRAIVIGHVDKSVDILPDLLSQMYPYMKAAGYRFATPSQLR